MTTVGQIEKRTQARIVALFQERLGYDYLGNKIDGDNRNIATKLLTAWLEKQGISGTLIARALHELNRVSSDTSKSIYDRNHEVYELLRYGVKVLPAMGENKVTVWLIDWKHPEKNHFAVAEEVTVKGADAKASTKRPDVVIYINGIAIGVLELKRSTVSVAEGIRQNLDNQKKEFIQPFFSTMQWIMAGNDTEGLRYATIETPEKYYLRWVEESGPHAAEHNLLDRHVLQVCGKARLLELMHDYVVFDAGTKKLCRQNQYFGVKAAQAFLRRREGGIIWHTQGSGKSLTMVWLAKWIRENVTDGRVLIITDRTELDEQIEKVFNGVDEEILRTRSGADLITRLDQTSPWLICSLVHKFGHQDEDDKDTGSDDFIEQMKRNIPANFRAKGKLFVFVDECHRTQSGKLHAAMKSILPEAMFIGFTGTPLMKQDTKKSVEIFGPYIHTYKFDEAVNDGVILDLRYEARDIDQRVKSQKKVDQWFDAKTSKLSRLGQQQLKQKWASMQKLLSSRSRLEQIVADILLDFDQKPRLANGRGNAMLVCSSVYQACKCYQMFSDSGFAGKCAIVTSYQPNASEIKGEESGEGLTEKLAKYNIYRKMLAEYFEQTEVEAAKRVSEFEREVKQRFIKEPGQMRLLIVVDKLLTGFDAPSATYLYIDKKMTDHNLFQAICRVNRLDGEDKEYGYIVDYKDLFRSLEKTVNDYTSDAFDGYDKEDVAGLLKDRLQQAKIDLDGALDAVRTLCEPVRMPRNQLDFQHYFCGEPGADVDQLSEKEALRLTLYQSVARLIRAFTSLAGELIDAGYSEQQAEKIRVDVEFYSKVRDEVKIASGDLVDMKQFEPGMRQMLDLWVDADPSETLMDFEELGLLELIIERGEDALDGLPANMRGNQEAMAEAIENNVRRTIVDENPVNPKYYEKMSVLLDELIALRRQQALSYQEYLEHVRELAKQVKHPQSGSQNTYPASVDTLAKRALYDNLGQDEVLVAKIDSAVRNTKKADWYGDRFKEREIAFSIAEEIKGYAVTVAEVMALVKAQKEYHLCL